MKSDIERIARKLRNAKARALYWSGNPSFTGKSYRVHGRRSRHQEYEVAMADIQALSEDLERLTGKAQKPYDPRQKFRDLFTRHILPALARKESP